MLPNFRSPEMLSAHIAHTMRFHHPRCIDSSGGFYVHSGGISLARQPWPTSWSRWRAPARKKRVSVHSPDGRLRIKWLRPAN